MSMLHPTGCLLLVALLGGCTLGDYYDREYVLYDSTVPAATGSPERAEQERIAADANASGGEVPARVGDAELERIFVLENLRDELARALSDGVGDQQALARKREDIDREIAWRRETAGEAYVSAREARLERLRSFPVEIR